MSVEIDRTEKEVVYGDPEGFHITVRRDSWESDEYNVTLWNRNHGTGLPAIFDKQTANAVAA